ncbi:MAG TPA: sugar transferase [Gemmataceae bacterium]|jgi:lipopolysaccharide/colanic/teichoic acid biosynthesis glycosyltransferase|nr:sugar transferase [Gemmataceae bacterium]
MLAEIDTCQDGLLTERTPVTRRPWAAWFKAGTEWALALGLLILTLPLLLLSALLVKLTSRGPIIYSQTRLGRNGRPYRIFKLRTMIHNCEKASGPRWAIPDDPRATALGRFLRRTHLDELPQLWNVLRGEMSLIGPRPERPEFATLLGRVIPLYNDRLLVRPGVTGLAQVQLGPDTDLESVRRKLAYDLYYVRQASLWLDVQILLSTAFHVFGCSVTIPRKLFGIPGGDTVEDSYRNLAEEAEPLFQIQGVN